MAETNGQVAQPLTIEQAQQLLDSGLVDNNPDWYCGATPVGVSYNPDGTPLGMLIKYTNEGEHYAYPIGDGKGHLVSLANDGSKAKFGFWKIGSNIAAPVYRGRGLKMDAGVSGVSWMPKEQATTDLVDTSYPGFANMQFFSQPAAESYGGRQRNLYSRGGQMKTRVPKYLRDEYGRKLVRVPGWGDDDTDVYLYKSIRYKQTREVHLPIAV